MRFSEFIILTAVFIAAIVIYRYCKKRSDALRTIERPIANNEPLISICIDQNFTNGEEERINLQFRQYLEIKNQVIEMEDTVKQLRAKAAAYKFLGKKDSVHDTEAKINELETEISQYKRKENKYDSELNQYLFHVPEIEQNFNQFIAFLGEPTDFSKVKLNAFFSSHYAKIPFLENESAVILTPAYAIRYTGPGQKLKLINYRDIRMSIEIDTEILNGYLDADDEVQGYTYRYTKKDGSADLRYKDNPRYTFVYRGKAILFCDGAYFTFNFSNRTKTEEFKSYFNRYLQLINNGYDDLIAEGLSFTWGAPGQLQKKLTAKRKRRAQKSETKKLETQSKEKKTAVKYLISDQVLLKYTGDDNIIKIPEGVVAIGDEAFYCRIGLKRIIMPDSVTKLGKNVFKGCSGLEYVALSSQIKEIPDGLFSDLNNLVEVRIAPDITKIGRRAFSYCSNLQRICGTGGEDLNFSHLKIIGDQAFYHCSALENFVLGDQVQYIGESAFANCFSLNTVKIGDHVDWHRRNCFLGTPWLKTQAEDGFLVDGNYLETYIGEEERVSIPFGIEVIGKGAFLKNTQVKEINIPRSVREIEGFAFGGCKNLQLISIPDSVIEIADTAFDKDKKVVIRCTRGSAASKFRIKNKILGEYVSKETETINKRSKGASDLSQEEYNLIMDLRRKQAQEKQNTRQKPVPPEPITYTLSTAAADKVGLSLIQDNKVITNNIFTIRLLQTEPVDDYRKAAEYEVFAVDGNGQIISNIKEVKADRTQGDMTYKVTLMLSLHGEINKEEDYYVILRDKGEETKILSKTPYKINIEFASEFDF